MLDEYFNPVICDFGLFNIGENFLHTIKFENIRWMAPELLKKNPEYSKKSDIFAFGMTIYSFVIGKIPWYNINSSCDVQLKLQKNKRPTLDHNIPQLIKDIVCIYFYILFILFIYFFTNNI